jgi:L-cystine uptake protein TcyP (sodium:dicarboxylate symporter family)
MFTRVVVRVIILLCYIFDYYCFAFFSISLNLFIYIGPLWIAIGILLQQIEASPTEVITEMNSWILFVSICMTCYEARQFMFWFSKDKFDEGAKWMLNVRET